jgi:hypothetical protein
MRNYKLGFTTEYTMRDEPGGWFKPSRVIFTPNTVHHAVENNKRLCVGSTFWVFFHGSAELLARPFDRRSVTCKACLDQLEANRIVDLEAEVVKLRGQADGHEGAITQLQDRNDSLCHQLDALHNRTMARVADLNLRLTGLERKTRIVINTPSAEEFLTPSSLVIDALRRFPIDTGKLRKKKRRG